MKARFRNMWEQLVAAPLWILLVIGVLIAASCVGINTIVALCQENRDLREKVTVLETERQERTALMYRIAAELPMMKKAADLKMDWLRSQSAQSDDYLGSWLEESVRRQILLLQEEMSDRVAEVSDVDSQYRAAIRDPLLEAYYAKYGLKDDAWATAKMIEFVRVVERYDCLQNEPITDELLELVRPYAEVQEVTPEGCPMLYLKLKKMPRPDLERKFQD